MHSGIHILLCYNYKHYEYDMYLKIYILSIQLVNNSNEKQDGTRIHHTL